MVVGGWWWLVVGGWWLVVIGGFILFDQNLAPESTLKMGERGLLELAINIRIMVLIVSSTSQLS